MRFAPDTREISVKKTGNRVFRWLNVDTKIGKIVIMSKAERKYSDQHFRWCAVIRIETNN